MIRAPGARHPKTGVPKTEVLPTDLVELWERVSKGERLPTQGELADLLGPRARCAVSIVPPIVEGLRLVYLQARVEVAAAMNASARSTAGGAPRPEQRKDASGRRRKPDCPQCGRPDTRESSRFGSTACKSLWVCNACREPFDHMKAI